MKIFTGKVISTKMAKTATVEVTRLMAHPIYGKVVKRMKKYHVHDEESTAKVGDTVRFVASKPFSKLKKWALVAEKVKEVKATKPRKAAPRGKVKKGETKK